MAHIKSISFAAVSTNYGCTCDKCGKWIKNIWTVNFDDGISMNFGIDCYEKMYKSGKLTKAGVKAMKDALKSIEYYTKCREEWESMTEADAKEKGLLDELDPNAYCNRYNKSDLTANGIKPNESVIIINFKNGEISTFSSDWAITF